MQASYGGRESEREPMSIETAHHADIIRDNEVSVPAGSPSFLETGIVPSTRRPLWLTLTEAEALLALSLTSPLDGGCLEEELFPRMSRFLHSFE
jgi:hypothetical protein